MSGWPAIQPGFFTVGPVAEAFAVSLDDLFRAAQVPPVTPGLWSAGYEGRDIDSFVTSLVGSSIDVVADTRLTPISRKKGSSKTRLAEQLAETGIKYTPPARPGPVPRTTGSPWDGRLEVGRARFRGPLRSEEAQADLNRLTEHCPAVASGSALLREG
ncbi:DUF488 family protein [Streptomyces sp. NPDC007901]|uniref:DUF488 family protein n=1 Tax=Streptomyces sp. NPDC007901 TaxID=3364785 RepID=UPI0036EE46F1